MKTLILSLTLLLIFYGCDLTDNSNDTSTPIHNTVKSGGIEYTLDIPTNIFSLDDTLSFSFKVKNYSTSKRQFNFANIQQLAYQIIDQDNYIATYQPFIVLPGTSYFTLQPGEIKEFNQFGFFKDHNGNYINRGKYSLSVFLANNNSPKVKLQISVN